MAPSRSIGRGLLHSDLLHAGKITVLTVNRRFPESHDPCATKSPEGRRPVGEGPQRMVAMATSTRVQLFKPLVIHEFTIDGGELQQMDDRTDGYL